MIHWHKIERTTILGRTPYHEVRAIIIRSARRNCTNRASQIQPHVTIIGTARRDYKKHAQQL